MATQDLNIKIVASDQTGAAFTSVKQKMDGLSTSAASVAGKIGAVTAALTSIAAVSVAIRYVSEMTSRTIALGDQLDELSARLNISVTELSAMTNAAAYAGLSQDELASSIMYLQKSIGEAAVGTKEQALAFKNLGISIKDASGNIRPTADILEEVADRLSQVDDGAIKTQYQMALFGRSGARLNEYLNKGSEGIKDFSNVISAYGAKAAADFNDNLTWMSQRVQSWLSQQGGVLDFINKQFEEVKRVDKEIKRMNQSDAETARLARQNKPATSTSGPKSLSALTQNDELAKKLADVRNELNKLIIGEDEALVAELKRLGASEIQIKQLREQLALKAQIKNQDEELNAISKEFEKIEEDRKRKQKERQDAAKSVYDSTRTGLERLNIEMTRLDEMLAKGEISWDTYARATLDAADQFDPFVEKGKDAFAELKDAINGWGNDFTNVMTESVMTGKLQFRDMANSIIKDLIRMQIQRQITAPLINMGNDFLSGLSGQRAMGGPVTGGNSYLVGENGPEIFTPGASGGITPNNQISGGGVTVVQTINVTTGVQQTVRAEIMNLMPQIAASAKSAVADAKLRGGSYANALR
jgi:lambda family phage tail tape measure protein